VRCSSTSHHETRGREWRWTKCKKTAYSGILIQDIAIQSPIRRSNRLSLPDPRHKIRKHEPVFCVSHLERARNIVTICLKRTCFETSHATLDTVNRWLKTYQYGGTLHNECMHSSHNRPTLCGYNTRNDIQQKFKRTGDQTLQGMTRDLVRWLDSITMDYREAGLTLGTGVNLINQDPMAGLCVYHN
jgi:hypothetical protein